MPNLIHSIHVKGFRSLADVEIDDLPGVAVLIPMSINTGWRNIRRVSFGKRIFSVAVRDPSRHIGGRSN